MLARYTSLFIIGVAVLAFFLPEMFTWVRGDVSNVVLGLIMLTMGCTLRVQDFAILAKRPWEILIGTVAQFTIMPLVAYMLAQAFRLDTFMATGLVLVGCCPGGVSSNIMSFLCKGDVAFSVGMTTVSTLLAPFVTPLLMLKLKGAEIELDAIGMFQNIAIVTLLPVIVGCILNYVLSRRPSFEKVQKTMPGISVICLAIIVGSAMSTAQPLLMSHGWSIIGITLAVVFFHNAIGYLLGYGAAKCFRFNKAKSRTLSIEVGMQNAGLATVLSNRFFANEANLAINPMWAAATLPCAVSCVYHSISGTLLAGLFNLIDKRKANKVIK